MIELKILLNIWKFKKNSLSLPTIQYVKLKHLCLWKRKKQKNAGFDEEAYAFYTGQLLHDARKEAKVTQAELAKRINSTKSYISRVENGDIIPSVAKFWEMIISLGMRLEIVK